MKNKNLEKQRIAANQNIKEKNFWLSQLADLPEKTGFPYDRQPAGKQEPVPDITAFKLPDDMSARLLETSSGSDTRLHVLLAAGILVLLNKYNVHSPKDILIGSPIDKQNHSGEFINTILVLRNRLETGMAFKNLIMQVGRTLLEASQNQNYPIEALPTHLAVPADSGRGFPLFDVVVLLENIHDKNDIRHIDTAMTFLFNRTDRGIEGSVVYDAECYDKTTVTRIMTHFTHLMPALLADVHGPLSRAEIVTDAEKERLLDEFNRTAADFPADKTIHQLFEEQVARTPDHIALRSPIDLEEIFSWLESGNARPPLSPDLKITDCCFKENPYIHRTNLEVSAVGTPLAIVKTHRHNSVIVNGNMMNLIRLFNGERNLEAIYHQLKNREHIKNTRFEFFFYATQSVDLLEVSFQWEKKPKIFSIGTFEDFAGWIPTLYRNHLIQLVDMVPGTPAFKDPDLETFKADVFLNRDISLETILTKDTDSPEARVLLLGDTPGMPTTGLLYLASYLRRNGITACCRFYEPARDYHTMKGDIEALLARIQPEVVGISMKWFLYIARVLDLCRIIKDYAKQNDRDIAIVVGGNTASYYSEDIIKNDTIDYLIRGDGEEPLLRICRGEELIPNCTWKKDGLIIRSPITYVQDESHSPQVYLSHMEDILLSHHASVFGAFFIYTHKGCDMNCLYCGGSSEAQQETFNRKTVCLRGATEVRKDIIAAMPYTSTFQFDFAARHSNLLGYCRQIWEGLDLSNHFCIFASLALPSEELIRCVSQTFKYVYWDFDVCSLSRRHRKQLFSMGLVKPQPSDEEIFAFMDRCEGYANLEVRINLITGLPYFEAGDITAAKTLLTRLMNTYRCFGQLHWARLHAQPGAPILEDPGKHQMHSYALSFDDFLQYSRENFKPDGSDYAAPEHVNYPFIYFNDNQLNSKVTSFYMEINQKTQQHDKKKKWDLIVCKTLSYHRLNEAAKDRAQVLRNHGLGPGSIVAIMLERSLDIPLSILAVLKTGAAYLPIDPEFPGGRTAYMLKDSCAAALVTTGALLEHKYSHLDRWQGETVLVDLTPQSAHSAGGETSAGPSETRPTHAPRSLAYVIYTSGTTGNPKGVLLTHHNLANYVTWFSHRAGITAQDKTILTSSFAFDLGYTSLYSSLLKGAELHLVPREIYLLAERLLDYIKQQQITYLKMTPSLFSILVNSPGFSAETCKTLRLIVLGGEAIDVRDVEKIHSICHRLHIMNHYGPTEATIGSVAAWVDFHQFDSYRKHPVIGKPIHNTQVRILARDGHLMPVGVPGELCISGTSIARGYLNRPELTREKFTTNRWYHTGDLTRWLPDGNIEFLGRIDNQVKIRGYRIELGEIETRLLQHPMVEESLVVVKNAAKSSNPGAVDGQFLYAYVVHGEGSAAAADSPGTGNLLSLHQMAVHDQPARPAVQKKGNSHSILTCFQQQVRDQGNKIAVQSGGQSLTYEDLDQYAGRLAREISHQYDDRCKLSKSELTRYKRQILLAGWGQASQEKLKGTTAFVAGAGGGASPTVTQLALAGFGTIKICDFDEVELSNLNRQFLHDEERLGMNKALSAKLTVNKINPHINLIPYTRKLTKDNVAQLVGDAAVIFDMFDGPADKFTLSEYAVIRQIPHLIIAMTDINAYAAVCHTPHTPCYHCLFDRKKLETIVSGMKQYVETYSKNPLPVVSTSLFISTGVVVNEALKILLGFEKPAYNKFFYFNQRGAAEDLVHTAGYRAMTHLFSDHFRNCCEQQGFDWDIGWRGNFLEEFNIKPDPQCPVCGPNAAAKRKALQEQMKITESQPLLMDIKDLAHTPQEESLKTVALLLDRDIHQAAAVLGAIKAGKTYVPCEPAASLERLTYILEDSQARVIVTNERHFKLAGKIRDKVNKNIKLINVDHLDDLNEAVGEPGSEDLANPMSPEQAAYMLYPAAAGQHPGPIVERHQDVLAFSRSRAADGPQDAHSAYSRDAHQVAFYHSLLNGIGSYTMKSHQHEAHRDALSLELREYLLQELPGYMIPSHFVLLDRMPLTPNGKVDRNALPEPQGSKPEKELAAPRNPLEKSLVKIWSDVLEVDEENLGIDHNFFTMGGHSLRATIMTSKVHKAFNVKVPLTEVFKAPTIRSLSAYISGANKNLYREIKPVEKRVFCPLSSAQKRLFFLDKFENIGTSYNVLSAYKIVGPVDRERISLACRALLKRHDSMRTSFAMVQNEPAQIIHDQVDLEIETFEMPGNGSVEENRSIINGFMRPFDLSRAPLVRVGLAVLTEEEHILLFDIHHIISDGTSHEILISEFDALYGQQELPTLKIQYKDFSQWQNHLFTTGEMKKQEAFWRELFSDPANIPELQLPTDYPRPQVLNFEGAYYQFKMESRDALAVLHMTEQNDVTLYINLLTAFNVLMYKYSGQEDIITGVGIMGRPHADLQGIVGFFVNTMAMRNYPQPGKSYRDFLTEVKETSINAFDNQELQFDELVDQLNLERNPARNPLFDVLFVCQNYEKAKVGENALKELTITPYSYENNTAKFDLFLAVIQRGNDIYLDLQYSAALFKESTVIEMIDNYVEILKQVVADQSIKLENIRIKNDLVELTAEVSAGDLSEFRF